MAMRPHAALAAAFAAGLLAVPAAADSVVEQIELALQYYQEDDYAGAISELEFAISEIRGKFGALYAATLPEPPDGWSADAAESEGGSAFFGGGTVISRDYRKTEGRGRIEAQLVVDNPMLQGFAALMSNPALMAAQPNTQRVRIARENAMLTWEEEAGHGEITMMIGGRIMAKLEGYDLESSVILVQMMESWDVRALKDLAGL